MGSRLFRALSAAAGELADALWPRRCWLCGEAAIAGEEPLACAAHALRARGLDAVRAAFEVDGSRVRIVRGNAGLRGARCERCAARLPSGIADGERCAACRRRLPRFARVLAAADYRGPLRDWLLAFKHGSRPDLAGPLARFAVERIPALRGPYPKTADRRAPLLVPVPLHPWRRIERGYDQAARLAEELGRELGLDVERALVRRRATAPQGSAAAPSRRRNVARAFALRRSDRRAALRALAGRHVWLVDDVLTSGATADASARALARAGAREVTVIALARAGHGGD